MSNFTSIFDNMIKIMNCFFEWLTDERRQVLSLVGTVVRSLLQISGES